MAAPRDRAVVAGEHLPETSPILVSIIIPVYNEASQLDQSLKNLFDTAQQPNIEVILSDGGSTDNSLAIAKQYPCKIINSDTGRARQMNAGIKHANGDHLLFLHADTTLPNDWIAQIQKSKNWGFFPIKLTGRHRLLRIIETAINLRSRISKVATGDQGLHFTPSFFDEIKGFPNIPIMEDVAISKRARRKSKPSISNSSVITSSRRWEHNGIIKTVFLMWGLRLAYWLGINPERLHRIY
jgi:rSAM/selenodomain-associated transferase 2